MKKLPGCSLRAVCGSWLLLSVISFIGIHNRRVEDPIERTSTRIYDDVIRLVVVACDGKSGNSFRETVNMVKSAVLFTRCRIHVHIFTINLEEMFRHEFSIWPEKFRHKVVLHIHPLVYPLPPDEKVTMMNWWGPCASFRLFLPTVMANVDSVLYVDTDILFLGSIEEIWRQFHKFKPSHVGALAPRVGWNFKVPRDNPNYISTPDGKMTQVNSGVFLMNLTRMREPVFKTAPGQSVKLFSWDRDFLLPLYRLRIKDMTGDQNLINTVFHYNPDLLHLLPCRYNYQHKFCFDQKQSRFCNSAEKEGALVVHGSANTFYNNYAPAFRAINDVITKYKFESDLERHLLEPLVRMFNEPTIKEHLHCSGKSHVFLQTLKQSLSDFS